MHQLLSLLSLTTLFITFSAYTQTFDKTEELNGVSLKSNKEKAIRNYIATTDKVFAAPINLVANAITNFTEKCNNAYKDKRKFSPKDIDCKYHNENLIESFIVRDIKPIETQPGTTDYFLIG